MADGGVFGDREQFWRDHITGWKSSGMSLRLYSEEHGLKVSIGFRVWLFRNLDDAVIRNCSQTGRASRC